MSNTAAPLTSGVPFDKKRKKNQQTSKPPKLHKSQSARIKDPGPPEQPTQEGQEKEAIVIPNSSIVGLLKLLNLPEDNEKSILEFQRLGVDVSSMVIPHIKSLLHKQLIISNDPIYESTRYFQRQKDYPMPYFLDPEQIAEFRVANPQLRLTTPAFSVQHHPHPLLHDERERMEMAIINYISRHCPVNLESPIVDVGGNPSRHHRRGRNNVWSCCPVLDSNDVIRSFNHFQAPNKCSHKAEDCQCRMAQAYMSIDSIYYLTPFIIAMLCLKSTGNLFVAGHHVFPDAFGAFANGEATYQLVSEEFVQMNVKGNSSAYAHSNLGWMRANAYHFQYLGKQYTLCWSELETFRYHSVTVFRVAEGLVPKSSPCSTDFSSSLQNSNYYGSVSISGALNEKASVTVVGELLKCENVRLHSWGPFVLLSSSGREVSMMAPKGLVSQIAVYLSMKERTTETLRNAHQYARSIVLKYKIPLDLIAGVLSVATALGFVQHLELETTILHSIVKPLQHVIPVHTDALNLNFKTVWRWKRVLALGLAAVAVSTTAAAASASLPLLGPIIMGVAISAGTVAAISSIATSIYLNTRKEDPFREYRLNSSSRPSNVLIDRAIPVPPQKLPSTDPATSVSELLSKELDPTATLIVRDAYERKTEQNLLVPAGIVSTTAIPIVPSRSSHSSLSSLVERLLKIQPCHTTDFDWMLFRTYELYCEKYHSEFFPTVDVNPISELPFDLWVSRFPLSMQKILSEARQKVDRGELSRVNSRGMFPKMEGNSKSDTEGVAKFCPRGIQSATPEHNSQVGPWASAFDSRLKKIWSVQNRYGLVYTSGCDAKAIGEYFSGSFLLEEIDVIEGDYNRYDTSIHSGFIRTENTIYSKCGAKQNTLDSLERSVNTEGFDKYRNRYTVHGTRHSGDPNTSGGNSVIQGTSSTFVLATMSTNRPSSPEEWIKILPSPNAVFAMYSLRGLLLGDDSCITVKAGSVDCKRYTLGLRGLGLDLEPKLWTGSKARHFPTFCSSRFYPMSDVNGKPVTILGPPIGRVIAKAGYYTDPPKGMDVSRLLRGDAKSRYQSSHCIPFLRSYWRRTLALTSGVESYTTPDMKRSQFFNPSLSGIYTPNTQTWSMILEVYGLTRIQETLFTVALGKVQSLPYVLDMRMFEQAFSVDCVNPNTGGSLPAEKYDEEIPEIQPLSTKVVGSFDMLLSAALVGNVSMLEKGKEQEYSVPIDKNPYEELKVPEIECAGADAL